MTQVLVTFAISLAGVLVFHLADLPLPWLLGPITASLAAALCRMPLRGIPPLNDAMRTILGVAVGATLTPAVVAGFPAMWPTLVLIPLMVLVFGLVGLPYFQRLWGYDFPTAYYAAMPGGLQDMLVFGEEAGGNVRTLSLIHATRVMVIVVALPFILRAIWSVELDTPPGRPAAEVPIAELALMVLCGLLGWRIAKHLGLFGASILGPMILAAIAAMSGLLHNRPPAEAIWAAQFFIGTSIGTKYTGVTLRELRTDLLAGFGFCLILIVLTLGVVELVMALELAPDLEALLAFAPGGQAEMTVLALIVGADVAFVIAHHVLRIFLVILGAPVAVRLAGPRPRQ